MKNVLIVCPYPHGKAPSQRFRFEQQLDMEGVLFTQKSFWSEDEWPRIYAAGSIDYKVLRTILGFWRRLLLIGQVRNFDKVFVHREATPIGPPWFEWVVARVLRKPIIFDFDDAIWLPNSSKANKRFAGRLKFHRKTAKICSWATTCSVGNRFLADYAKQYCDDVRIIPTTIDTTNYHNPDLYVLRGTKWVKKSMVDSEQLSLSSQVFADHPETNHLEFNDSEHREKQESSMGFDNIQELRTAKAQELEGHLNDVGLNHCKSGFSVGNRITIGWTGTHSTLKQLVPLFPILEEVYRDFPFRFLLIADNPPENMPSFVEFREWQKKTEVEDLLEIDVGVMPLYDSDWERGKCGFKALQYMALGRVSLVSEVGVNKEIIQNSVNGFTLSAMNHNNQNGWKRCLIEVIRTYGNLNSIAERGRNTVVKRYSLQSTRQELKELF